MSTNETTPLLRKPASDLTEHLLDRCANNEPFAAQTGKRFTLWQIAAFFGIMLARADTSLVWATHETVASHFDNLDNSSWMMTSFAIGCCVTYPLYGRLSDDYGRLRPLIAGYVLFCIGVILWSFLGQAPIATTCCIIMTRGLRNLSEADRDKYSQMEEPQDERQKRLFSFDYPGAVTLVIWVTSFLVVIDLQAELSWANPLLLSLIIIGIISFVVFLVLETYSGGRELLIPLSLVKTEVGAFCLGQLLLVGSCQGLVSQIVPYFINSQKSSDTEAGWLIVPVSIGNAVGSLVAGRVLKRSGSYKKLSLISLFLSIAITTVILVQWSYPMSM
ncbi:hypothetical protein V495_01752 [Pseudogymnoascus sp. VKM F-4514 (FW-929)]|nr:hypothetical protein V495_01752 [Pseudogymnoascus sp. VKM F-4514 (FW-929)]